MQIRKSASWEILPWLSFRRKIEPHRINSFASFCLHFFAFNRAPRPKAYGKKMEAKRCNGIPLTQHSFSPKHSPMKLPALLLCLSVTAALAEINKAEKIADDVYFHEGDLKGKGHCNNGWIVFAD